MPCRTLQRGVHVSFFYHVRTDRGKYSLVRGVGSAIILDLLASSSLKSKFLFFLKIILCFILLRQKKPAQMHYMTNVFLFTLKNVILSVRVWKYEKYKISLYFIDPFHDNTFEGKRMWRFSGIGNWIITKIRLGQMLGIVPDQM